MQVTYLHDNIKEKGLVEMLTAKDRIINQYVFLKLSHQLLEAM